MTASLVWMLVLSGVVSVLFVVPTLRRLFRKTRIEEISPDWLARFSPATYHPMESLLNNEDFAFLSRQPGFDLSLYRKLRQERLQIFRQYLTRMITDFNRLHLTARVVLAHSKEDHSDLFTRLIWLKIRFSVAVIIAEYRYALCLFGVRSLNARALILRLEELNAHVLALSSQAA